MAFQRDEIKDDTGGDGECELLPWLANMRVSEHDVGDPEAVPADSSPQVEKKKSPKKKFFGEII